MDGCNWSGKIYSKPLKEWMSATAPWEKNLSERMGASVFVIK